MARVTNLVGVPGAGASQRIRQLAQSCLGRVDLGASRMAAVQGWVCRVRCDQRVDD